MAAFTRAAARSPYSRNPLPPMIRAFLLPFLKARAAFSMESPLTALKIGPAGRIGRPDTSADWKSFGTISVAIRPRREALTASTISREIESADPTVFCHPDTVPARDSMSMAKGGSFGRCHVVCSPMMLTTGVPALLALWRFATPFARPGPKWSSVIAGVEVTRPYPSAAPVQTPSKRPSTGFTPLTLSIAATSGISVVPGFEKHMSMPQATAVFRRSSAPFTYTPLPMYPPIRPPGN